MCVACGWEELLEKIEDMQGSGDFDWAEDTLSGIHGTVSDREHCTDNQAQAIDNIKESLNR